MMVRRVANETTAEFCQHIGSGDWRGYDLGSNNRAPLLGHGASHDAAQVLPG